MAINSSNTAFATYEVMSRYSPVHWQKKQSCLYWIHTDL